MAQEFSKPASKESIAGPLRFAHPFFAAAPPGQRQAHPAYGQRMLDHVPGTLHPIPDIKGDGRMSLADVIGKQNADAIAATNQITLHIAGDTGVPETDHETNQVIVADAMAKDYDAQNPQTSPAFFLHLGDVLYGPNPAAYLEEFYRPYMHYPGKIVAIPGNHDGESDPKMAAFQQYFCAASQTIPPIAGSIFRQTMNQPGVYWCLDAPFVQIVGLYSNSAENPGYISGGKAGEKQKQWLLSTLQALKATRDKGPRKALLLATHHPPYSSGGHSGSATMLAEIDTACGQASIWPDAFFSGHAHSIQRYTRSVPIGGKTVQIPYIVSGCGGHGGQTVAKAGAAPGSNPSFDFAYKGWGYTKAVVTPKEFTITSYGVDPSAVKQVDSVTIALS
jgi:Calcineurin-like phosphoesterase